MSVLLFISFFIVKVSFNVIVNGSFFGMVIMSMVIVIMKKFSSLSVLFMVYFVILLCFVVKNCVVSIKNVSMVKVKLIFLMMVVILFSFICNGVLLFFFLFMVVINCFYFVFILMEVMSILFDLFCIFVLVSSKGFFFFMFIVLYLLDKFDLLIDKL